MLYSPTEIKLTPEDKLSIKIQLAGIMGAKNLSLSEVNRICREDYTEETRPDYTKKWIVFPDGNIPDGYDHELNYHITGYDTSWDWQIPVWHKLANQVKAEVVRKKDEFKIKEFFLLLGRYEGSIHNNLIMEGFIVLRDMLKFYEAVKLLPDRPKAGSNTTVAAVTVIKGCEQ